MTISDSPDRALGDLRAAVQAEKAAETGLTQAVLQARSAGVTWQKMAEDSGLTLGRLRQVYYLARPQEAPKSWRSRLGAS